MTSHTPSVPEDATGRPWRTEGTGLVTGPLSVFVANTFTHTNNFGNDAANAALIVRAVNSHEALVALLDRAVAKIDMSLDDQAFVDEARLALSLARGEQTP